MFSLSKQNESPRGRIAVQCLLPCVQPHTCSPWCTSQWQLVGPLPSRNTSQQAEDKKKRFVKQAS